MKSNTSNLDRIVRIIVSIVFVILFFTGTVTGIWGYVLLAAAAIFTITAAIGFCPIWALLGINTLKKSNKTS
jgi:uncharacterized membrane protein required for colicin V production